MLAALAAWAPALGEPAVLVVSAVVLAALVVSADITKFASLNGGR